MKESCGTNVDREATWEVVDVKLVEGLDCASSRRRSQIEARTCETRGSAHKSFGLKSSQLPSSLYLPSFSLLPTPHYFRLLRKWFSRSPVRIGCLRRCIHVLTNPNVADISLAAFGRKEIEIAEVCDVCRRAAGSDLNVIFSE
jgi:hypothetical protein